MNGNFTVASGETLAPGNNDLGALSFSNALTLNAGSKTIINVSHDSQTNNVLFVAGTITWGGALVISNADDLLQAGDAFQLFSGPGFTGNFNSISLPTLTPGLYWNTNTFKTDATIRVLAETPPVIGSLGFANGKLAMSGSGGVTNGTYYVLTTTNLALPATNWTRLQTNQFDGNGNFSLTAFYSSSFLKTTPSIPMQRKVFIYYNCHEAHHQKKSFDFWSGVAAGAIIVRKYSGRRHVTYQQCHRQRNGFRTSERE